MGISEVSDMFVDSSYVSTSFQFPDQIKIAILMNETTRALQQHLHLNASATITYMGARETITEYYRTTAAFTTLQQQQQLPSPAVGASFGGGTSSKGHFGRVQQRGEKKERTEDTTKEKENNKERDTNYNAKNQGKGYGYGDNDY